MGLWIAVVGKTQPAKLLVDKGTRGWMVEYANNGGEATVQERSMKPCTSMQKRTVDKLKAHNVVKTALQRDIDLAMVKYYSKGRLEPPLQLHYSLAPVESSGPKAEGSVLEPEQSSDAEALKLYLTEAGLEAWHGHLTKHLHIKTPAQLETITAVDLKRMAMRANMRLDLKTTGEVLKGIRASRRVCFTPHSMPPGVNRDLLDAAHRGDLAATQRACQAGGQLSLADAECGFCALIWASQQGHWAVAAFLLDEGSDVNAASPPANFDTLEGNTALMRASRQGHTAIVSLLLERRVDTEITLLQDNTHTALAFAIEQNHLPVVQMLVQAGANPQLGNPKPHKTALMKAAHEGFFAILEFLLALGECEENAVDACCRTALIIAAHEGHVECVHALLSANADATISDATGTAADAASEAGHTRIAAVLRALPQRGPESELEDEPEPGLDMETSAITRTSTLRVRNYTGTEITVMFHGTDSLSAQLIVSRQRFRPSASGLPGQGIYLTWSSQKAEGYRVFHPNAGQVGRGDKNAPLPNGDPDPGCILQCRVRLGAMKTLTREANGSDFEAWHNEEVAAEMLQKHSSMQHAAQSAGLKQITYNSAFSAGCSCCQKHGEACPAVLRRDTDLVTVQSLATAAAARVGGSARKPIVHSRNSVSSMLTA